MTVTLKADGLADLDLDPPTYEVLGQRDPLSGSTVQERIAASSILIDGDVPVHIRKGNRRGSLSVLVWAETDAALEAAVDALTARLDVFEFELHLDYATGEAWRCYAADFTVTPHRKSFVDTDVLVQASFPIDPNPLNGGS